MDHATLDCVLAVVQKNIDAWQKAVTTEKIMTDHDYFLHYDARLKEAQAIYSMINYLKEKN